MVVPYADPSPIRDWQNYFDTGEYLIGQMANSLQLGCDCLGDITYLDAVIADQLGNPRTIANAICIHEEDYGILWKHRDDWAGSANTKTPTSTGHLILHHPGQLRLWLLLVPLP